MKLVYLPDEEPVQSRVCIEDPTVEFELEEDMALQLIEPLHSLSDSGDIW